MADESEIRLPVRFNPFKHHRNYILRILDRADPEEIIGLLDTVCNNYIDIYIGIITPEEICNAVIVFLKANEVFHPDDFTHWVGSKNGYRQIQLEDRSEWIVRKGVDDERYIHIHPTRTGPFTIRFKGSTLKTVYLLKTIISGSRETLSLEMVNLSRIQIGLPPVKKLDRNKGILKCYRKFFYPEKNFTID